jgi:hypothetical protein
MLIIYYILDFFCPEFEFQLSFHTHLPTIFYCAIRYACCFVCTIVYAIPLCIYPVVLER